MGLTLINAGRLNKRITIFNPSISQDSTGDQITTYSQGATIAAEVVKPRGQVAQLAEELIYLYPLIIRVRHFISISDFAVILYDGNYYLVDSNLQKDECRELNVHQVDEHSLTFSNVNT